MRDCPFCRIVSGQAPGQILYQDEQAVAFADLNPQAPVHLLVIPCKHLESLAAAEAQDESLLGHLLQVGVQLAQQQGIAERGFRTVINTGREGGQTVAHLHLHIIGGRFMAWPPG